MADVGRQQDLGVALAGQYGLGDLHAGIGAEFAVDAGVGQAEAPGALIIAGDVGHRVRQLRQAVQMRLQLGQIERGVDRLGIIHDRERTGRKVGQYRAVRAGQHGGAAMPTRRHGPVEHFGTGRDGLDLERHVPAENRQRLADARPGQAAQDRE